MKLTGLAGDDGGIMKKDSAGKVRVEREVRPCPNCSSIDETEMRMRRMFCLVCNNKRVLDVDGEQRLHWMSVDCWCKPTNSEGVLVHHSRDGRELFESDYRPELNRMAADA